MVYAITQPFLAIFDEILHGTSGDYYCLGMTPEQSKVKRLFSIFDFLATLSWKKSMATKCILNGPGACKLNKNVSKLGGPFGSTVISKSCFCSF